MADLPRRAHRVVVAAEGDSTEDLCDRLNQVIADIRETGLTKAGGGGRTSHASFSYVKNPDQTHDKYFEELEQWLLNQTKERKKAKG